jgi:hypothetical protein
MESPLDPASIHNPTVEVEAPGMVSVETLNPFDKTEVLVTGSAYFLDDPETGVARALANNYWFSDMLLYLLHRICRKDNLQASSMLWTDVRDCGIVV